MELMSKKINALEVGDRVDCFFMIKRVDLKTTNSNDKKYLDFIFGDKTGEISAKLWDVTAEREDLFSAGDLVKVRGTVTSYMNTPQFKVERIRHIEGSDGVNAEDFVVTAPLESDVMMKELGTFVEKIENRHMKAIVLRILEEKGKALLYYPAAKRNHHAIKGGLLYHVLTMLRLAQGIVAIYPQVEEGLLYAGIILHDLEKIGEMDSNALGIVSEYTVEGTLLGHITMGVRNVERVAHEVGAPREVATLLEHMILAHHSEPEYGSPVRPMFLEAELLHHIDMIDARIYDFTLTARELAPGTFSDPIWSLDRRRIYRPNLESMDEK